MAQVARWEHWVGKGVAEAAADPPVTAVEPVAAASAFAAVVATAVAAIDVAVVAVATSSRSLAGCSAGVEEARVVKQHRLQLQLL